MTSTEGSELYDVSGEMTSLFESMRFKKIAFHYHICRQVIAARVRLFFSNVDVFKFVEFFEQWNTDVGFSAVKLPHVSFLSEVQKYPSQINAVKKSQKLSKVRIF